jgi:hypothetical protein
MVYHIIVRADNDESADTFMDDFLNGDNKVMFSQFHEKGFETERTQFSGGDPEVCQMMLLEVPTEAY